MDEQKGSTHLAMTAGSSGRGGAGEGVLEGEDELEDEDELETEEELELEAEVELDEEGDEQEGDHKLEGVDALEEGGEDAGGPELARRYRNTKLVPELVA